MHLKNGTVQLKKLMSGIRRLFPLQSFSATHNSPVNYDMFQTSLPLGYLKSDIWSLSMIIKYDQDLSLFFRVFLKDWHSPVDHSGSTDAWGNWQVLAVAKGPKAYL